MQSIVPIFQRFIGYGLGIHKRFIVFWLFFFSTNKNNGIQRIFELSNLVEFNKSSMNITVKLY